MVVRILGQEDTLAYKEAERVVKAMGLAVWDETYFFVDVVIAPLMEDSETTHTYGTLQLMAGVIEASITPENADPDVQHADDVEFSVLYPDPELSFKTKMADIPLTIQEMIFGNAIDDNGVLVRTASDRPPYFAVGFKSEKSDGTFRYVWLFKVRAKPVTETYATKEGTSHLPG